MLTTAWGPVGTRGGCGAGWGPRACPGGNAIQWGLRGAPQRGQAPGPLIHSTPPLVPTGPWAASTSMDRITPFGRQHSLGARVVRVAGQERYGVSLQGLYGRPPSLLMDGDSSIIRARLASFSRSKSICHRPT